MKALLHQPFHETFESRPDLRRPSEILPRQPQRRTLAWQITLSYPSPPMSSPPSPQRKLIDNPPTISDISSASFTTTTTAPVIEHSAAIATTVTTSAPALATAAPLPQPLPSHSESTTFRRPSVHHFPRASTSSIESQIPLVRTESASSASAVTDFQITAGPSTATASPSAGRGGRRSKAHVANACNNCKRAHLSCDVERPCNRCTQTGKADTCRDVPHKKRGRPRLRDEGDFRIIQPEAVAQEASPGEAGPSTGNVRPLASVRHRRTGSLRTLRSYPDSSGPHVPMAPPQSLLGPAFVPQARAPRPMQGMVTPTAFLDLDLVVLKANRAFHALMGVREARGLRLTDLATPLEGDSFQNTRNSLRAEREAKEPAYLPPIVQPGLDPVHGVSLSDQDIDEVTRGFDDQHYTWIFRLSGGVDRTLSVRVRLSKTSVYFVTLFLPPLPESQVEQTPPMPVPGQAQQLYRTPSMPMARPPSFQGSPSLQMMESPFAGREATAPVAAQSSFYHPQSLHQGGHTLPPGPSHHLSRSYPPFEPQPRFQPQPQHQPQYQQAPYQIFQSPLPHGPMQTIQERVPSAPSSTGSAQSMFVPPSPYVQTYTSSTTRPRSATLESLGRHVQTRLRADSGVTASSPMQSSPLQRQSGEPHSRRSSDESVQSESAHRPSPRKRRRMNLDEVLHQR